MSSKNKTPWTNQDEIKYLQDLPLRVTGLRLVQMLRGYIKGAKRRSRWNHANSTKVISLAYDLLDIATRSHTQTKTQ